MADPFVGEIRIFGGNFAPVGWMFCDGSLLPIAQNSTLFALIGTTYGGDGRSNFALPNLQSACVIGPGNGPGLSARSLGEVGGTAQVALQATQMPQHSHGLHATQSPTTGSPAGAVLAPTATGAPAYHIPGPTAAMAADALLGSGGSQPHGNRQPYLGMMFCIALQGIFPSRQ